MIRPCLVRVCLLMKSLITISGGNVYTKKESNFARKEGRKEMETNKIKRRNFLLKPPTPSVSMNEGERESACVYNPFNFFVFLTAMSDAQAGTLKSFSLNEMERTSGKKWM